MTPNDPTQSPGAVITRAREAAGMTRYRLAKQAGVSAVTLAEIEAGSDARLSTLRAVFAALGLSLAALDLPK